MPVPRDKLILWAICALYQRAQEAGDEPMRADFALKVVLGCLHSAGCDRRHTDAFWKAMRANYPPPQAAYSRATYMRTQIECIMRSLKVGDPLFRSEVADALGERSGPVWSQHKRMLDHLRRERQQQAAQRRADKDCGWL